MRRPACVLPHSTDLYYEITPSSNGLVIIKNTGDHLLSVTKLKISGEAAIEEIGVDEAITYANAFDSLPAIAYDAQPENPAPGTGEVIIANPEPGAISEAMRQILSKWLEKVFAGLDGWFD